MSTAVHLYWYLSAGTKFRYKNTQLDPYKCGHKCGHNPRHTPFHTTVTLEITSGPRAENAVLRGKARNMPGSSLQQRLMPVWASPGDPLNTLASSGGAAQGARVGRAWRAEAHARRPVWNADHPDFSLEWYR